MILNFPNEIKPNKCSQCMFGKMINNRDFYCSLFPEQIVEDDNPLQCCPCEEDISEYSDKLWKKAYERGKSEARPQGHWIIEECSLGKTYYCSECYAHLEVCFDFCPYCGADMRREAENE